MKVIYKYPIKNGIVTMPEGAEVLSSNLQGSEYYVWSLVDTDSKMVDYPCKFVGTGWTLEGVDDVS